LNPTSRAAKKTDEAQRGVAAVDRALSIIATLEASSIPLSLSEISRVTGLYKSTILRLLVSLQNAAYVVKVEESKYVLGPTIMQLGLSYERANPLRHIFLPVLQRLVDEGSESASFHVRQTTEERLCIFRKNSNHSTLDRVGAGDRLPIRRGAAGKILLAFGEEFEEGSEMEQIRESCFAVSHGERDKFCAGVAAPVFSQRDRLMGALSLSGPKERFTTANVEQMKNHILSAARELTSKLGGTYPA